MIKAHPINKAGDQSGPVQEFSVEQFERMKRCFKNPSNFRWKITEGGEAPKEMELISTKNAKPKEESRGSSEKLIKQEDEQRNKNTGTHLGSTKK